MLLCVEWKKVDWAEGNIVGSMQMPQPNDAQRVVLELGQPFRPMLFLSEGNRPLYFESECMLPQ